MTHDSTKRRARTTGQARIDDVARVAGVSAQTVSRYFRRPAKVAPSTRERIRLAVEQTSYVPNLVAGSLASNRTNAIGIIVPTIANPVHAAPVQGLSDVLRPFNYQVLLGSTGYDEAVEADLVTAFLGRRLDGIIVTGVSHETGARNMLKRAGIPVIEIWELPDDPIDMAVGFSNREAGAAVARHFFERGRRRLAVVAHGVKGDTRSLSRQLGFCEEAAALGLDAPLVHRFEGAADVSAGVAARQELMRRDPAIDAIFAVSDLVALGILLDCRTSSVPVPGQVAVAGCGDSGFSVLIEPGLTTISVPGYELGSIAGNLLVKAFNKAPVEQPIVDVGFRLVVREST